VVVGSRRSRLKRVMSGALVAALLVAAVPGPGPAAASGFLSDAASHPPPTTGAFAYYDTYGSFGPDRPGFPGKGESFVDPVFGSTLTRLTNEVGSHSMSDIYGKNGFTNADNTLVVHNTAAGRNFIDTRTGAVVRANVPGNDNASFAPDDPDVYYWYAYGSPTLSKYSVRTGSSTAIKTFSAGINNNGGSIDWIDASGRYMVLRIGNTWRVYDVKSDVLYAGSIPDVYGGDGGYGAISPDGNYIITTNSSPAAHRSWAIDHANRTVSTTPNLFWSLCGDHGDLVSATNGKTYFVTYECDSVAGVFAVDVSLPQSQTDKDRQRATNRMLF